MFLNWLRNRLFQSRTLRSRPRAARRSFLPRLDALEDRCLPSATTFLVTNVLGSGPGSLRQAVLDVDADTTNTEPDLISFAIPGGGAQTITLASDADRSVMTAYGAYGEKKLYGKVVQGVIRSTIVLDEKGKVELAQYNVKATGHVAKLRRDLGLDA